MKLNKKKVIDKIENAISFYGNMKDSEKKEIK